MAGARNSDARLCSAGEAWRDETRSLGSGVPTLAALGFGGAAAALAALPTVTLSGEGRNGSSPDSITASADVNATLSGGLASGTLNTSGRAGGFHETWVAFNGNVTCMVVEGKQVTVGALGTASRGPVAGPGATKLPGSYAQLLTVEFGEFKDPYLEYSPIYTAAFGNMPRRT